MSNNVEKLLTMANDFNSLYPDGQLEFSVLRTKDFFKVRISALKGMLEALSPDGHVCLTAFGENLEEACSHLLQQLKDKGVVS